MADYPVSIDRVRRELLEMREGMELYAKCVLNMVLTKLEGFPPMDLDAVPVVRCRECWKRGNERECPMCHEEFDGCDYCTIDYTSDDGFCHMGKKMDAKEVETDGQEGT